MSETDTTKAGMRGWIKLVFGLSLALNLLVVGAVAGVALRHGGFDRAHHGAHPAMVGGPLTRALSDADKRAVARDMRRVYRAEGRGGRAAYGSALREFVSLLRAETFDADQARDQLELMRSMMGQRVALGQQVLIAHLGDMEPSVRAEFAERLEEAMKRRWSGRK
jgi:uncharacterized membrane protein